MIPSLYWRLKDFDIIHLHYPFFGGVEPLIIRQAIKSQQSLVITYHMDAVAHGLKGLFFKAHRYLFFSWLVRQADKILVSTKEYAETSVLMKYPKIKNKIEIQPFGIDLKKFHSGVEKNLKEKLGLKLEQTVFIFVGGLDSAHYFKGFSVLLEALNKIKKYSWSILIIGQGNLRQDFINQVKELGLASRFIFLDQVSDQELPQYFRIADIHCFPSTERAEAFGLVALEAGASGLPSVASNLPGVNSVVLDKQTGLLVSPNNVDELSQALLLLLKQEDLRKQLGRSARLRAEADFAWEPLITNLEQIYQRVVKNK